MSVNSTTIVSPNPVIESVIAEGQAIEVDQSLSWWDDDHSDYSDYNDAPWDDWGDYSDVGDW